jgi:hypothetical protein
LLIFESCGNVYAREEFVQAKDVGQPIISPWLALLLLTVLDPRTETSELVRIHSPAQAALRMAGRRWKCI